MSYVAPAANITITPYAPSAIGRIDLGAASGVEMESWDGYEGENPDPGLYVFGGWSWDYVEYHSSPKSIGTDAPGVSLTGKIYQAIGIHSEIMAAGSITFWVKTSCAPTAGFSYGVGPVLESISFTNLGGENDWQQVSVEVTTPGLNYFAFFYQQNGADDPSYDNAVWIDDVMIPMASGATLTISTQAPGPIRALPPAATLTITGYAPSSFTGEVIAVPAGSMTLTTRSPAAKGVTAAPVHALSLAQHNPAYLWQPPASEATTAQVIYLCVVTGDADGLDDLTIPIASFQARRRNGESSFLSCVIPDIETYEDAINARSNGDIVIRKGYRFSDGTTQVEEIVRVNFESPIRIDQGHINYTGTIAGTKTWTAGSPKSLTLSGISYRNVGSDGKRRYRASVDLFLRPGDTAVYGAEQIEVGLITYYVEPGRESMEVTEA